MTGSGSLRVADLGSHLIDQAICLFGPPVRIYAEVDRRRPRARSDDDVFIAMEHAGGERSHLHMGKVAPLPGPRFRVSCVGGGIQIDGLEPQESQLGEGLMPGSPGYGERDPGRRVTPEGEEPLPLLPGSYQSFYEGVEDWIRNGGPRPVDPRESLLVMRVIDAARESSGEYQVMPFESRA